MVDSILYQGDNSRLQDRAAQTITKWRKYPELYVKDVLKVEIIEPWQLKGLRSLSNESFVPAMNHISIRSGHGVGKSAWLSWLILWYTSTHFPCKVPCTAPTSHQLEDILWAELAVWRRKMGPQLSELFEVTSDRMYLKLAPDECYAVARTARKENPDALQGFHAENLLFVVDEASGVPDEIFQPLEGALSTPGAKSVLCGNPTRVQGYFYDSHHRNRAQHHCITVSCHESSRVAPAYITKMKAQYGEESNVFRVRVLGEFPLEAADVLIPLSLVEPAIDREVAPTPVKTIWGLDPARYGECLTALAKRKGNTLLEPIRTWGNISLMETVGKVYREYEDTPYEDRPYEIVVDVCGLGAGVVDRLLELGLPVIGVNAGEAPPKSDAGHVSRMRDWLWWEGRKWFEKKDCNIANDQFLVGELTDVHYSMTSSGKIVVESKRDMLDRGVPSPDRADAFNLTFAGSIVTSDAWEAQKITRKRRRSGGFMAS
jgi:hypothetical protein